MTLNRIYDCQSHFFAAGNGIGGVQDKNPISDFILEKDLQCICVATGGGITPDVNGIAVRPNFRKNSVQAGYRAGGQFGKMSAFIYQCIGGKYANSTAVGQNGKLISP